MKKIMMVAVMALMTMTAFAQLRVEAGYLTSKQKVESGDASDAASSFKVGGYYMINDLVIEKSVVEAGLTFTMGSYKEGDDKVKFSNFAIPVNAGYKIDIADEFSVRPYVGINLKFNTSYKFEDQSLFDSEFDSFDPKRFQFGGQLGGLVQWKQFTAGYQYQTDFTSLYSTPAVPGLMGKKNIKTFNSAITVGMIF